jgi:hypothetical protein
VLRKLFGSKRDEEIRDCGILHNKELHDLCVYRKVVNILKSGTLQWAGKVARTFDIKCTNTEF